MQMPGWMAKFMQRTGLLAQITVVGRKSGLERTAIVNSKPAPGGGFYVAAGDDSHQWAQNLRAAGRCRLMVRRHGADYVATELEGEQRASAARILAPPFADPAKSIRGPVFRLDPDR